MANTATSLSQHKPHFQILDGLRGVAALSVVTFHFMEIIHTTPSENFIGHGFLAVDFFFCLSGFVIGYAYDDRIRSLGTGAFFKARIIRLHPLVVLGSVLGLLTFLSDPFGGHPEAYTAVRIALLFLCSVLLVPFPVMTERFDNNFGLNAPAWSLFWEYIANIMYAVLLSRISRRVLGLLTLLAAVALSYTAWRAQSLVGGWDGKSFWDGGARVFFSFTAGLLIYRSGWKLRSGLGFMGVSLLLMAAFVMPYFSWNWLAELAVVLFYFPFLIALGTGAALARPLEKLCIFLGRISYPLYMTHYAALWMFNHYYNAHKPTGSRLFFIVAISILVLTGFAWLVMQFYDTPVRAYLNRRLKREYVE